jgi:xylulokinase
MTPSLWLVFDLGTSGAKAALLTDDGQIMRSADAPYPTHSAPGSIVEQRAEDWWSAVQSICQALRSDLPQVKAIAATGQMQDLILVDAAGASPLPVILYSDRRAQAEADEIIERVGAARLRALTGNDQGADSLWAKLLWLQRHHPEALHGSLLFGAADYLAFRLTGIAATDMTTASTTGLMDLPARRWLSPNVLGTFEIGDISALLPQIVTGGAQVGAISAPAAQTLGLTAGIPVFLAPGDAGATTIGADAGELGRAYGYLGTSGWIGLSSPEPGNPEQGVFTLAHPRANHYMQVAPLLTAGGNLDWISHLFEQESIGAMINEAIARPISDLIYLPYLNGERSPFSDPVARGAFIGLNPTTERAALVRAVLEGVAFAYRHTLESLMPQPPEQLYLTGGGTRSDAWCQLLADVLHLRIIAAHEAEYVAVRGALLSAQVARGDKPSYTLNLAARATLHPNFAQSEHYERKYQAYRAAYPALKPIFGMLGRR